MVTINANNIRNAINKANNAIASVKAKPNKTFPKTFELDPYYLNVAANISNSIPSASAIAKLF